MLNSRIGVVFCSTAIVIFNKVALVFSAPEFRSSTPFWYTPCGSNVERSPLDIRDMDKEIRININNLRIQFELMMNDYLDKNYEFLYERVRIGVHEHQYIPDWLPGKREVHAIRKLANANPKVIAQYLPKFYLELQKFAVALEQIVKDDPTEVRDALLSTQIYLKMMICEVETSITALPMLRMPNYIERSIMSQSERYPIDDTQRLVRDWGVLLKYKDYLYAWKHVFKH